MKHQLHLLAANGMSIAFVLSSAYLIGSGSEWWGLLFLALGAVAHTTGTLGQHRI
jgi:hypothetical protein